MNILLITNEGYQGAGSSESIALLSKGLAARGHNVFVGCHPDCYLMNLLKNSKAIAVPMHFKSKISRTNMREIRDVVKNNNIQIINAQSSKDRYTTIFAKWFYGIDPIIVHTRRQTPRSDGGILQRWFYILNTKKIVTVSNELRNVFISKGYPPKHIKAIFNGLPDEIFTFSNPEIISELKQKHGFKPDDKIIGCVSRHKKQEQLLSALKYLDPSIKVIFIGVNEGFFNEFVVNNNIKNEIIYTGRIDKALLMNYYKIIDVKVLPSTTDGFGLVLVEAMGSGTPVIGTKYAGIIDVLDNEKNGLWFEDGDCKELANKIETVLYNENERKRLIENGLQAAKFQFNIENTISEYETFFNSLIEEK